MNAVNSLESLQTPRPFYSCNDMTRCRILVSLQFYVIHHFLMSISPALTSFRRTSWIRAVQFVSREKSQRKTCCSLSLAMMSSPSTPLHHFMGRSSLPVRLSDTIFSWRRLGVNSVLIGNDLFVVVFLWGVCN